MKYTLADVRKVNGCSPARILIYGEAGIGKTTFASKFPDPIFLLTEDTLPKNLTVYSPGIFDKYEDILSFIDELIKKEHRRKTLVIDTVTKLQDLIHDVTCRAGKKDDMTKFQYGKGLEIAEGYWNKFIAKLDELRNVKGMNIVLIGHSKIERYTPPDDEGYDRYSLNLSKKAVSVLSTNMDAVLLMAIKLIKNRDQYKNIKITEKKVIYTSEQHTHIAKNRYDMPAVIPVHDKTIDEFLKYLPSEEKIAENKEKNLKIYREKQAIEEAKKNDAIVY